MAPPILLLSSIHVSFGGAPLLAGAELSVSPGERLCLVGRNGSGKSTLLKIAAGLMEPDAGVRFVQPGTTLRYLAQEPDLAGFATTLDYVAAGLGPGNDPRRPRRLLERLGLTGTEDPARLSGGEARRAALARVLAPAPDVLLLDEPTNHLDLPAIEWLEGELAEARGALVLVSHDRRLLTGLARATVWLHQGTTRRRERGFADFESWREQVFEEEDRARQRLDKRLATETEWLHKGITARRRRNQGRLRRLQALRAERRAALASGGLALAKGAHERSGDTVIEAEGVAKAFGGRVVVRGLTLRVRRGDRIGIVGPNGAGKTTLLKLLTGALAPDAGTVRRGTRISIASLDQGREALEPGTTLARALTGGAGETVTVAGRPRHVIGFMKDLLFSPEQARTPVGALSGGERGRILIARALAADSSLLVLDEPTNDLDLETLDLLQDMLGEYAGTVLLVSHDRDFLDRVVTSVIAAEGGGRWIEYAGGYSDMIAQRGAAPAPAATAAPRKRPPARRRAPAGRTGLSYKEKHALETLPGRIEALTAEIADLRARLADPTLYARDPEGFAEAAGGLARAEAARATAEEEWLALELKREALEGG